MLSAVDGFISYIDIFKNFSKHTLECYKRDLLLFYEILRREKDLDLNNLEACFDKDYLLKFMAELHERGYSSATKARHVASLKSFFNYLRRERDISNAAFFYLERPHVINRLPSVLTQKEVSSFLELPDTSTFHGARDSALLEILYGLGARASEVCDLNMTDIEDGFVTIRGKGQKERLNPINKKAQSALENYLCIRKEKVGILNPTLFVTREDTKIDRIRIWQIIKKYLRKSGLNKNIYPHSFRHAFASHLHENGCDIRVLQELMGHADISTTGYYISLSTKYIEEQFNKYHPRP